MENTTSKRLVKNKLNTIQWRILNHIKVYADKDHRKVGSMFMKGMNINE